MAHFVDTHSTSGETLMVWMETTSRLLIGTSSIGVAYQVVPPGPLLLGGFGLPTSSAASLARNGAKNRTWSQAGLVLETSCNPADLTLYRGSPCTPIPVANTLYEYDGNISIGKMGRWVGEFMRGGGFVAPNGDRHYFAAWPETRTSTPGPNAFMHFNRVVVKGIQ